MKKNGYSMLKRLGAFALAALMVFGLMPVRVLADGTSNSWPAGEVTTVADPDTVSRPVDVYGDNTENAGKVTVGKSVSDSAVTLGYGNTSQTFTPDDNNFIVTISQTAQVMGLTSESSVPLDVVFVLDTSGSMNQGGVNRAASMVTAANSAIKTLMEANEHNRIAVVAFSDNDSGYGTSNGAAANVLSSLAHYTGDAASAHLQWVDEDGETTGQGTKQYIAGRDTVTVESEYWWEDDYEMIACRHGYEGGTNIQAGIITGAKLLTAESNNPVVTTEEGTVTRMPFIVILSDGQPTYSYSDSTWYNPTTTDQQGNGNNAYAGNGFLPALTAAYYKGAITEKYYGTNASEENRCSIYTIGVQLNEELAEITLNPKENFAANSQNGYYGTFSTYWDNYSAETARNFTIRVRGGDNNTTYTVTAGSISASKNYVNGKSRTGAAMYAGGLAYNDEYFAASNTEGIIKAFQDVVTSIQKKAISSPTEVDSAYGDDFSGYVTFTDPIGEYMEVKDMYGVLANGNWYRGKTFAQYVQNWSSAPQEFKDLLTKVLEERCKITGATFDMDSFIAKAAASTNQAYYNSDTDYDNSIVWWGNDMDSTTDVDEQVQYLGFADNDTIEYITDAGTVIPEGADYVCRSYFFYGTAGNTAINPNHEYLYFVVRVQRSLKAPYQQTVVVSAPASLLSVEQVLITESTDEDGNAVYTATVTEAEPARVVYEVGLRSDINAFNVAQILAEDTAYLNETATFDGQSVNTNYNAAEGTYTFYTNDWNRTADENSHERAMAKATFDAASDNAFYTYQEDTLIYVKEGDSYVPYTGEDKPVGSGYYYAREVYDWSGAEVNEDGTYTATKKTVYISVYLPDVDAVIEKDGSWYIEEGSYTASSLTGGEDVSKSANNTQTSEVVAHPHRTASETDSHYTVYLGNNGKLTLKSEQTKSVSIAKADNTVITDGDGKVVMVGDILTYSIDVVNPDDAAATANVEDMIPHGTAYVAGSATNGGVYDAQSNQITWTGLAVPANSTVTVSFQVEVTEAALTGDLDVVSIDNTAYVTLSNGFVYETNTTVNPPEGKKVVDTSGNAITGGVEIPDVLVYRIRWHNDSGQVATVTVTDIIPDGTTYVENSASHNGVYHAAAGTITWTLTDVQPDASGVVSFRVNVNASAVEYISNDASIKVGDNDPRQTNDTKVTVNTGDLVLSKSVVTNGFDAAATQSFTLNITEIGLGMDGTYTMLKNGTAVEGGVTFVGGVATVTIKDGEEIEIQGIPAGAIISVTEVAKDGFTPSYQAGGSTSASEGRVTIVENSDVSVAVTNSYTPDAVTFQLEGTKVLDTAVFVGDLVFGFTAYGCDADGSNPDADKLLTGEVTVSSAAKEATIVFSPVTFSQTGTHYYLISEINGGVTGVTYDGSQYLLKIVVTDDGSGQLKASASVQERADESSDFVAASDVEFTNTYAPKETQLALEATKVLDGRDLKEGEFSFVVKEGNTVVSTGTNAADGKITFRPITYTKAGTYTYTISEVNGGLQGVEYSTTVHSITVTVTDVNGQLTAVATYPTDGVKFTNTYTPTGITVTLEADKTLTNKSGDPDRVLGNNEFNFVVKDENGNVVTTGTNDASGKIVFNAIGYTVADKDKTFTYTVSEVIPDVSGDPYMDYDESTFTVIVAVTYDATTGTLSASVTYPDGGVKFNNTQYPDSIEVQPKGSKTTTAAGGSIPTGATFAFTVIDVATDKEVGAGVGNANGDFLFSKLTYSEAGTYLYWIKETHAGMEQHGIEYDDAVFLMEVVVTNTDGELEAAVTYYSLEEGGDAADPADYTVPTDLPAFKNHYNAQGQIAITAKKVLENLTLKAGDFAFRLVRQDNGHVITGVVDASGNIQFATLYFDLSEFAEDQTSKTIHYKMSEVVPETGKLPGVTYDTSVHDVYITITHNGDGTISAAVADAEGKPLTGAEGSQLVPTDSNVTFTNTYAPEEGTTATIQAVKDLTGRDLADGEFSFDLYHVDEQGKENLVATASNDANGKISFTRTYAATVLNGADSRVIKYVIREVDNRLGGVTYDGTSFHVTVTITDNKDGTISSVVAYEGLEQGQTVPVFRNTYDAKDTTYTPEATKVLENRVMADNEFSFVILDKDQNVVSTGTSKADGTVSFSAIGFTKEGCYTYTVREVKGNLSGVTYTDAVYYLVVTVEDNGDGTMTATGEYSSDAEYTQKVEKPVFTNVYTPESVSVQLEANKILNGRDMEAGEFSFVVEMLGGTVVATGGNVAADDGESAAIIFSAIGYKLEDLQGNKSVDLVYRVREVGVTQGGVTGDATAYYAWVRLSLNEATGKLETSVSYYADEKLTQPISGISFENTYAPESAELVIPADKTLINKDLEAGEFTFTLKDSSGKVLQAKTNAADGTVIFDAIEFSKPGVYTFTVSERVTDQSKAQLYTLDDSFTVVVTVVDDLKGNLRATATYHVNDASGNYDAAVNLGGVEFINHYTAPPVTVDLSLEIGATKTVNTPEGITYSPAGFRFEVRDIRNTPIAAGTSDAEGKISFTDFTFTQAGEYHYWVYEVDSGKGGITEDARIWEIHILVRYNEQTGLLYINDADVQTYPYGRSAAEGSAPAFVNVYQPAPVELDLTATKVLEGRELQDREFLFYLMEGNTIAAQAYNAANGTVTFELIYTQIGSHTYSIVEHQGSLGGVTYNDTVYGALTVEIKDNGDGQLVAYVGNQALSNGATVATGVSITNVYEAKSASAVVLAHKSLTGGKTLKGDDFVFELRNKDDDTEAYTAKNNLDGHVEFMLSFEDAGVYTYILREVKGTDPSITYDESEYIVTVTVEDDGKGQLLAAVTYDTENGHAPVFENAYKAAPVTAEIKAHKTLTGEKPLAEGQYTFELEGEGVKISDITNDANGNVVFHVKYDTVGEYTYVIRETKGSELGTTYDETEYTVKVTVTDDLNGQLVAEVSYEGVEEGKVPGFTNSYKGEKVPVKVTASKKLTGKALAGEDFTFQLVNKQDPADVLTAKNDANGNVAFDLTFESSGVYVYTLSEVTGTDANMTYDLNSYTVTITVTDDLKGYLVAKVEYSTGDGAAPVFNNAYTPNAIGITLNGTKKLTGKDLENGEFSFQVRDSQGNLVATAKNTADGKIVFSEIKLSTAGKYTFSVSEVKGTNISVTYDETVFTVVVNVVNDNGILKAEATYPEAGIVFENVYEKYDPENPDTGDSADALIYMVIMTVSLLGCAAVLVTMKKRAYASR